MYSDRVLVIVYIRGECTQDWILARFITWLFHLVVFICHLCFETWNYLINLINSEAETWLNKIKYWHTCKYHIYIYIFQNIVKITKNLLWNKFEKSYSHFGILITIYYIKLHMCLLVDTSSLIFIICVKCGNITIFFINHAYNTPGIHITYYTYFVWMYMLWCVLIAIDYELFSICSYIPVCCDLLCMYLKRILDNVKTFYSIWAFEIFFSYNYFISIEAF